MAPTRKTQKNDGVKANKKSKRKKSEVASPSKERCSKPLSKISAIPKHTKNHLADPAASPTTSQKSVLEYFQPRNNATSENSTFPTQKGKPKSKIAEQPTTKQANRDSASPVSIEQMCVKMTLDEFHYNTNIVELIKQYFVQQNHPKQLLSKMIKGIDVTVKRVYNDYLAKPEYRRDKLFDNLEILPQPIELSDVESVSIKPKNSKNTKNGQIAIRKPSRLQKQPRLASRKATDSEASDSSDVSLNGEYLHVSKKRKCAMLNKKQTNLDVGSKEKRIITEQQQLMETKAHCAPNNYPDPQEGCSKGFNGSSDASKKSTNKKTTNNNLLPKMQQEDNLSPNPVEQMCVKMTLDEFHYNTNIVELIKQHFRQQNHPNQLLRVMIQDVDVYVKRVYNKYLAKPEYRREKLFHNLEILSQPIELSDEENVPIEPRNNKNTKNDRSATRKSSRLQKQSRLVSMKETDSEASDSSDISGKQSSNGEYSHISKKRKCSMLNKKQTGQKSCLKGEIDNLDVGAKGKRALTEKQQVMKTKANCAQSNYPDAREGCSKWFNGSSDVSKESENKKTVDNNLLPKIQREDEHFVEQMCVKMTLDEFSNNTNIKELIKNCFSKQNHPKEVLKKIFAGIEKYVVRVYSKYMRKPQYRRDDLFKNLKITSREVNYVSETDSIATTSSNSTLSTVVFKPTLQGASKRSQSRNSINKGGMNDRGVLGEFSVSISPQIKLRRVASGKPCPMSKKGKPASETAEINVDDRLRKEEQFAALNKRKFASSECNNAKEIYSSKSSTHIEGPQKKLAGNIKEIYMSETESVAITSSNSTLSSVVLKPTSLDTRESSLPSNSVNTIRMVSGKHLGILNEPLTSTSPQITLKRVTGEKPCPMSKKVKPASETAEINVDNRLRKEGRFPAPNKRKFASSECNNAREISSSKSSLAGNIKEIYMSKKESVAITSSNSSLSSVVLNPTSLDTRECSQPKSSINTNEMVSGAHLGVLNEPLTSTSPQITLKRVVGEKPCPMSKKMKPASEIVERNDGNGLREGHLLAPNKCKLASNDCNDAGEISASKSSKHIEEPEKILAGNVKETIATVNSDPASKWRVFERPCPMSKKNQQNSRINSNLSCPISKQQTQGDNVTMKNNNAQYFGVAVENGARVELKRQNTGEKQVPNMKSGPMRNHDICTSAERATKPNSAAIDRKKTLLSLRKTVNIISKRATGPCQLTKLYESILNDQNSLQNTVTPDKIAVTEETNMLQQNVSNECIAAYSSLNETTISSEQFANNTVIENTVQAFQKETVTNLERTTDESKFDDSSQVDHNSVSIKKEKNLSQHFDYGSDVEYVPLAPQKTVVIHDSPTNTEEIFNIMMNPIVNDYHEVTINDPSEFFANLNVTIASTQPIISSSNSDENENFPDRQVLASQIISSGSLDEIPPTPEQLEQNRKLSSHVAQQEEILVNNAQITLPQNCSGNPPVNRSTVQSQIKFIAPMYIPKIRRKVSGMKVLSFNESDNRDYFIEDDSSPDPSPQENYQIENVSPPNPSQPTNSQLLNQDETYFRNASTPEEAQKTQTEVTDKTSQEAVVQISVVPEIFPDAITSVLPGTTPITQHQQRPQPNSHTADKVPCLPRPIQCRNFACLTYVNIRSVRFEREVNQMRYESKQPFMESHEDKQVEAIIKVNFGRFQSLLINGNTLRILLGLTGREWKCVMKLFQAIEQFEYIASEAEPTAKSLPYRILYHLFKTLPKFSQAILQCDPTGADNEVKCFEMKVDYFKPVRCLSQAFQPLILEKMKALKASLNNRS